VFLDEAHEIRNHKSVRFQVINYLTAKTKWCLTGTPIWNSADDLFSLKAFIGGRSHTLVDKSYIHIRTKDILPMPAYNVQDVDCKFTSSQLTQYKKFERQMITETITGEGRKKLLGYIINLRRMCNHADTTSRRWGVNVARPPSREARGGWSCQDFHVSRRDEHGGAPEESRGVSRWRQ
jgi:SNF2 family DNA or RNA helicase